MKEGLEAALWGFLINFKQIDFGLDRKLIVLEILLKQEIKNYCCLICFRMKIVQSFKSYEFNVND